MRLVFAFILFLVAQSLGADAAGQGILHYLETKESKPDTPTIPNLAPQHRENFEKIFGNIVARSLYERKTAVSSSVLKGYKGAYMGDGTFRVYATCFGNPGNKGESNLFKDGTPVKRGVITAALPHPCAVGKVIRVRRILKDGQKTKWIKMTVRDLGPWFRDDPYWITKTVPRAVPWFRLKKRRWDNRVVMNPAGIDLTPWAWGKLGIPYRESLNHSGWVEWKFD